jgi:hypothetical protein
MGKLIMEESLGGMTPLASLMDGKYVLSPARNEKPSGA